MITVREERCSSATLHTIWPIWLSTEILMMRTISMYYEMNTRILEYQVYSVEKMGKN